MIAAVVGLIMMDPLKDPLEILNKVNKTYAGLKSFSMSVERPVNDRANPIQLVYSFKWRSGNRFELIPTRGAADQKDPMLAVPYKSDGKRIQSGSGKATFTEPFDVAGERALVTQLVGGVILARLMDPNGPVLGTYIPPKAKFLSVQPVVFDATPGWDISLQRMGARGRSHIFHVYTDHDQTRYLGHAIQMGSSWERTYYRNQVKNPVIPATLGTIGGSIPPPNGAPGGPTAIPPTRRPGG